MSWVQMRASGAVLGEVAYITFESVREASVTIQMKAIKLRL